LHAGSSLQAGDKKGLETLCRYIARSAVSEERLTLNSSGQIIYKLKNSFSDGTTHLIMAPLDFLEKLAALVPRPRVNLIRFHGVFAPHFKHRNQITPHSQVKHQSPSKKNYHMTWAKRLARVFEIDVTTCPICKDKLKIIACIDQPEAIKNILLHLHLDPYPPQPSPPRGPPETLLTSEHTVQNDTHDFNQAPLHW